MTSITQIAALGVGAVAMILGGVSGLQQYKSKPHSHYMAPLPLKRDGNRIGQAHRVGGAPNVPAKWEAWVTDASGVDICRSPQQHSSSYQDFDGEYQWFDVDDWVDDSCGIVPPNSKFTGKWEYKVQGQTVTVSITADL